MLAQDQGRLKCYWLNRRSTARCWRLYAKDPFEQKYHVLINRKENVGIENEKNPKSFIDYSQAIDGVYEDLED